MAAIVRATPIGVAALCALAGIIAGEARAGSVAPAQNRMLIRLPQGSRVRFSRFARCHLAKLQARGPKGCPRRSKVGHGRVSGSYLGDQVHGTYRLYNGERLGYRRTLFVYVEPERGPTFVQVARWFGRKLDLQLALLSPYQAEPALSNFEFALRTRFLDSPCGGTWTVTSFFITGAAVGSTGATACP